MTVRCNVNVADKSNNKLEALKKRPEKRPDWKDLMKEIEQFRYSHALLKKSVCNDRSSPMISKTKQGKNVCCASFNLVYY